MYCLDKFCCICMTTRNLKHLFEVDNDGVSHYNKLTSSIVEMNFKEMNNQRRICEECCVTLNTVYNFRQMCLKSKTNLITHISQLQTSDHISGTSTACHKDIKPKLIVVKNRRGSEESNPQIKFQTDFYKVDIDFPASIKKEYESEDDDTSAYEDAMGDHVNEFAHSYVKVEDVEHQIKRENYSEYYTEFNKIEIEEHQLEKMKEEPMSDTETPQDGSTSQADKGISEEPKGNKATTIETELTQNTQKQTGRLHQCEICQKSFNRKNCLMNHMQTHSSKKSYECKICKKSFSFMCHLTSHMLTHTNERLHECEICKKGFKHKGNLNKHMNLHSSERPFICEICKKGFKDKRYLTVHMETHSSERPYECEICKKSFKHKYLTKHMKTHFSGRPYECEICKKSFKHKDTLTIHMKTHFSIRPYECEVCKKGFKLKDNMIKHMKIHSIDRPYECEICKKRFDKKTSCIWHMKRH